MNVDKAMQHLPGRLGSVCHRAKHQTCMGVERHSTPRPQCRYQRGFWSSSGISRPFPCRIVRSFSPSSPLGEGQSQVLLRKLRTGRIDASNAVFKVGDRVALLEARPKGDHSTMSSLRRELDGTKQNRAFKPIHPNHEEERAYFLGPQR